MLRSTVAILLVAFLSFTFRLSDPDHGLPCDPEPDLYTLRQVETLREDGLLDRYLAGWKYPMLFSTITAALPWRQVDPPRDAPLQEHLDAASTPHRWLRLVMGIIAALAAPLTVVYARRFTGLEAATLAGLFVATSGMHLWMSVQARPHAPTATMVLLALIACARWFEKRRPLDALLAGLAVGGAGAALHSGLAACIPWGVCALAVLWRQRLRALPWVLLSAAIVLAFVVWAYGLEPHEPRDWYVREQAHLDAAGDDDPHFAFGGHLLRFDIFNGGGFYVLWDGMRALDPTLGLATLFGSIALAFASMRASLRKRVDVPGLICTAAFFTPFMLVFGAYELSYWRFFLPVVPIFALLASAGMVYAVRGVGLSPAARGALYGIALAVPMVVSQRIAWLVSEPTAHARVAERLEDQLAGSQKSAALLNVRPLCDWTPESILTKTPDSSPNRWLSYQIRRLEEWPDGTPPSTAAFPIDPLARLTILRADDPPSAAAKWVANTGHDLIALSTTWYLPHDTRFRGPELTAWRTALEREGWVRTDVVEPLAGSADGFAVPKLEVPALFRRSALGERYEIYERP